MLAYLEINFLQAEMSLDSAQQAIGRKDHPRTIAHLACSKDSHDNSIILLNLLRQIPAQPAIRQETNQLSRILEARADRQDQLLNQAADQMWRHNAQEEADEEEPELIELTQAANRIRVNAESLRHSRTQIKNPKRPSQTPAYRYLLFDLYHNTIRHQELYEHLTQDPGYTKLQEDSLTAEALHQCHEAHKQELANFNEGLNTRLGPALEQLPEELKDQAKSITVEPIGFQSGVLAQQPSEAQEQTLYLSYLAYSHDGQRQVHAVSDPHPKGFPENLAFNHLKQIAEEAYHSNQAWSQVLQPTVAERLELAALDLHTVTPHGLQDFFTQALNRGLNKAAVHYMIESATDSSPEATQTLLTMGGMDGPLASQQQAAAVINAGKRAGLDEKLLNKLASEMGWHNPENLGITLPKPGRKTLRRIARAADRAGFPPDAVERMEITPSEP